MKQLKPYNHEIFKAEFSNSALYHKLEQDFDLVIWETFGYSTPRVLSAYRVMYTAPFYYLNFLLETNTETIYDIGCGGNLFKKYIPNVIGIDPDTTQGNNPDIIDRFDDDFVTRYENKMDAAFSICSIHFIPFNEFPNQVNKFARLLKPGGRGYLAFNSFMGKTMMDPNVSNELFPNGCTAEERQSYFIDNLVLENSTLVCLDVDVQPYGCPMNGDIRIVIQKNN